MAKVWVQVWTAQVPGSVEVEEALLREVEGLDSVKAMVPMLVEVKDSDLVPPMEKVKDSEMVQESQQLSEYQKKAMAMGWGWVLGLEGHHRKSD
jgi:hypothetical protein